MSSPPSPPAIRCWPTPAPCCDSTLCKSESPSILTQPGTDPAPLLEAAGSVEQRLRSSGLFRSVGLEREQQHFPSLVWHITDHLYELFDAAELERDVLPRLAPDAIREALTDTQAGLTSLDTIGQAHLLSRDPLGLRGLVLSRLSAMAPSTRAEILQGHLVSADRHHLLIVAEPAASAYDTVFSRRLSVLLAEIAKDLEREHHVAMHPVGAYRAALDNETTIKDDTTRAVAISTACIALLLFLGFPRPWIGLLALFPALAGTMAAVFVYSLLQRSIPLLAIGFGGAIISFTVDYGVAYLLFLDRPSETRGLEVTREIWSIGMLAMLTTALSFAFLFVAGFPALSQLGLFASLGVVLTYAFVHGLYPFLFPTVRPAKRVGRLPLQHVADWLSKGGWPALAAATLLALFLLAHAKPDFRVDLESMNTVSPDTLAAEQTVRTAFGNVLGAVSLSVQADSIRELRDRSDALTDALELEMTHGVLERAFVPSMVFPGQARSERNRAAWRAFFTPTRAAGLRQAIAEAGEPLGFAPEAFDEFLSTTSEPPAPTGAAATPISEDLWPLLGIGPTPGGPGYQVHATVVPGPRYDGERFYADIGKPGLAKLFDPTLFSNRLGGYILKGFVRVAGIVGFVTVLVAALYLLDARLTLIGMLPTVFSLICTVGTLRLAGRPLGIPVIMVCAVVIGMGSDYALYLVRSYQRYRDEDHPSLALIRLSVLLSFATTFVGFGALAFARHSILTTAGTALALGIGYSYLGTITLVPPLARLVLADPTSHGLTAASPHARRPQPRDLAARVRRRYRHLEPYPRLFARFKLAMDPMFPRLAELVGTPRLVLDVGCGFGIPAAFLLEHFPHMRLFGIDPDPARCRVAARVLGEHATIAVAGAPHVPVAPEPADTALLLDIAHYLDDLTLGALLAAVRRAMRTGGRLVLRATVPAAQGRPRERRLEQLRLLLAGQASHYRTAAALTAAVEAAAFRVVVVEAPPGREETWIVAESVDAGAEASP